MSIETFTLPDVGEGLTEAEIVSWKVRVGEQVALNQPIVEIETAKSLVELPCPYAGIVADLLVSEGQTVPVGEPIIAVSTEKVISAAEETPSPLVGAGPSAEVQERRGRRRFARHTAQPAAGSGTEAQVQSATQSAAQNAAHSARSTPVLAKPPVRKLAKERGIDLEQVQPTGAHGEVTRDDVESFSSSHGVTGTTGTPAAQVTPGAPTQTAKPEDPHEFWAPAGAREREVREPVRGVRKATAHAMVTSAFSAPHVSIFVDVDASRTMEFVKRLKASRDFAGIKVSPLLILAKAVIWAAERNPQVNATWGDDEILIHRYMNLGIAASTPRGLLVPNVKNAHELSLKELAIALQNLAETARAGNTTPADMQAGTLTITNIGALGIDTGTPIINPGEVAIVAFGTIKQKPWVLDGEVLPRWVTTLGGSFDHRVVDGDLSARFMADVASILEEPAMLLD